MKRRLFKSEDLVLIKRARSTTLFSIGDKVQLVSGGPEMTVHGFLGSDLVCSWLGNLSEFAPETLERKV